MLKDTTESKCNRYNLLILYKKILLGIPNELYDEDDINAI